MADPLPLEDGFKRQSFKVAHGANHQARMQELTRVLIEKKVLSKVHRFDEVEAAEGELGRNAKLPDNFWTATEPKTDPLPLKPIYGTKREASFPTFSPHQTCKVTMDLAFTDIVLKRGWSKKLHNTWMQGFVAAPNMLVKDHTIPDSPWLFVGGFVPGTAQLGWPAQGVAVGGSEVYVPRKDLGPHELHFVVILDLKLWHAVNFEWLSSWGLLSEGSDVVDTIAAKPQGPPAEIHKVCAKEGFHLFPGTFLDQLAVNVGCHIPAKSPY